MILVPIGTSSGEPAGSLDFNLIQKDYSGYIYASGFDIAMWIYNQDLSYKLSDTFVGRDFQLWGPTGYFVQTNYGTNEIRIANFDGTSITQRMKKSLLPQYARGCAVNGTYCYFWQNSNSALRVYDYSGSLVQSYEYLIYNPMWMSCFDGGTKLMSVSASYRYLQICSLSGSDVTLIDTYDFGASCKIFYPYMTSNRIIVPGYDGTRSVIYDMSFDGSSIALENTYPFDSGLSPKYAGAIDGYYGDSYFINVYNDLSLGSPFGFTQIDTQDFTTQTFRSTGADAAILSLGDGTAVTSFGTAVPHLILNNIIPATGYEHFQAIWR